MYKTLHKKQGSVTVQLRFARSSVTFCAKRDSRIVGILSYYLFYLWMNEAMKKKLLVLGLSMAGVLMLSNTAFAGEWKRNNVGW